MIFKLRRLKPNFDRPVELECHLKSPKCWIGFTCWNHTGCSRSSLLSPRCRDFLVNSIFFIRVISLLMWKQLRKSLCSRPRLHTGDQQLKDSTCHLRRVYRLSRTLLGEAKSRAGTLSVIEHWQACPHSWLLCVLQKQGLCFIMLPSTTLHKKQINFSLAMVL